MAGGQKVSLGAMPPSKTPMAMPQDKSRKAPACSFSYDAVSVMMQFHVYIPL